MSRRERAWGELNLTPIAYAARTASVPRQAEALAQHGASRPGLLQPDPIGPNFERILHAAGSISELRSDP